MAFTEKEKRAWHMARRRGEHSGGASDVPSEICGHCGTRFPKGAGVVTDDFAICDVCND